MPTNDEPRAMIERQDQLMMKLRVCLDSNIPATTIELDAWATDAAAMLRSILAERAWLDMDSAPKDGTWVLLTGGQIDYGWEGATRPKIVSAQFVETPAAGEARWQFANYDSGYYGEYENPQKWKPLPKGDA